MDAQDRLFGEIAVRLQLLSREQLASCIKQKPSEQRRIGDIAHELGFMSKDDVELVLSHQQRVLERRREAAQGAKRPAMGAIVEDTAPKRRDRRADTSMSFTAPLPSPAPTPKHKSVPEPVPAPVPAPSVATAAAFEDTQPEAEARAPAWSRSADDYDFGSTPPIPKSLTGTIAGPGSHVPAAVAPSAPKAPSSANAKTPTLAGASSLAPLPSGLVPPSALNATIVGTGSSVPKLAGGPSEPNARSATIAGTGSSVPMPPSGSSGQNALNATIAGTGSLAPTPSGLSAPNARSATVAGTGSLAPTPVAVVAPNPLNATIAGPGPKAGGPSALGATLLQPSGAVAKAFDRGWRNPTRPPPPAAPSNEPIASIPPYEDTNRLPKLESAPLRPPSFATKPRTPTIKYLDGVLNQALEAGASDVHVHAGAPICMRNAGQLLPLTDATPLSAAGAERVIAELMNDAQWETLAREGELRFGYDAGDAGRFRAQIYRQEQGLSGVFRMLPRRVPSLAQLGLPAQLGALCDVPRGLSLFTGPANSGKSTSLAAVLAQLIEARATYVICLEQPIEHVHWSSRSVVVQCEVPSHVPTFADGVELALAQGASLIMLSELSDPASAAAAVRAAEAGASVFASLRAPSLRAGLARMLDLLADSRPSEQASARSALASTLRVICHQTFGARNEDGERAPLIELLPCERAASDAIRSGALERLPRPSTSKGGV